MKNSLLIISLIVIDLFLLLMGTYNYVVIKDLEAPTIILADVNITYKEGEDTSKLLTGIKANDNIDGDLTKDVFIEKIVNNTNDTVIVYYGVVDSSNNATIVSRVVNYEKKVEEVTTTDTNTVLEDSNVSS